MYFSSRLVCLIVLFGTISFAAHGKTIDLTADQLTSETYNPAKILATTNKLIALGKEDAEASLLNYAKKPFDAHHPFERSDRDDYLAWLCLLVYDPKLGLGLPEPMFGEPDFPDYSAVDTASVAWPRFPLALSRGVLFLLVRGYLLGGFAEPGVDYLKRCQTHGTFHTTSYPIPTQAEAEVALHELISSPQWKALKWSHWSFAHSYHYSADEKVEFLHKQVERIQ